MLCNHAYFTGDTVEMKYFRLWSMPSVFLSCCWSWIPHLLRFSCKCYWPHYCIVKCFYPSELHFVPHLQKTCIRITEYSMVLNNRKLFNGRLVFMMTNISRLGPSLILNTFSLNIAAVFHCIMTWSHFI